MPVIWDTLTGTCGWCTSEFPLRAKSQLGAISAGRLVYCSDKCKNAHDNANAKLHEIGPCLTCNKMFWSKTRKKKYCSLKCCLSDPKTLERLKKMNDDRLVARGFAPTGESVLSCLKCGAAIPRKKKCRKFCGKQCHRAYYAERFDRWIASPEGLALPQNYDEFLLSEKLPCLVIGCDWEGESLAYHSNVVHGITADQLRELAGFNKTTGLVTSRLSKSLSERALGYIEKGILQPGDIDHCRQSTPKVIPLRLEAKEHQHKALAVRRVQVSDKVLPCLHCRTLVIQPVCGAQLYCDKKCRQAYYRTKARERKSELVCDYCGTAFKATPYQVKRKNAGNKVVCGIDCRCKMNMAACLASRGIPVPSQLTSVKP